MSDKPLGPVGAFTQEVGRALLAIVATTFSLVWLMSLVTSVAEATEALEVVVNVVLSLVTGVIALGVIGYTAGFVLETTAAGWVGLFTRQVPRPYTGRSYNQTRAIADLVVLVLCVVLGLLLFRHGAAKGYLHWALQGLLLIVAGGVFGLLPLVPRVGIALARRRMKGWRVVDHEDNEKLLVFVLATMLGVGLSMGVTSAIGAVRARGAKRTVAVGALVEGVVVGRGGSSWPEQVELTLPEARTARVELRLLQGCVAALLNEHGQVRQKIPESRDAALSFQVPQDRQPQSYRLRISPTGEGPGEFRIRVTEAVGDP